MDKEQLRKKIKAILKETIDTVVFVLVMVIVIRFFVGEIRWIPSGSMRPTLVEGDRIFVEKVTMFFAPPSRGDVMVFYPPFEKLQQTPLKVFERLTGLFCKDEAYIKRIIGMPGDKIAIKEDSDGKYFVYVNGKKMHEKYILDNYDYIPCQKGMYCGPMTVPADSYFMMGDNRGNSKDSRFWGFLPKDRFIGKAVFLFWPVTRMKGL